MATVSDRSFLLRLRFLNRGSGKIPEGAAAAFSGHPRSVRQPCRRQGRTVSCRGEAPPTSGSEPFGIPGTRSRSKGPFRYLLFGARAGSSEWTAGPRRPGRKSRCRVRHVTEAATVGGELCCLVLGALRRSLAGKARKKGEPLSRIPHYRRKGRDHPSGIHE